MDISGRIEMVIRMSNHTASSFSEAIGVQRSSVSHILSGRNKPSLDFLQKVLNTFPRVNGHWLLTGEHLTADEEKSTDASNAPEKESSSKRIHKVMVFYDDGSYEEVLHASADDA